MVKYILRRLILSIPLLVIISFIVFFLGEFGARDLALERVLRANDGQFDADMYAAMRAQLNLDQPLLLRYVRFMTGAVRGDFGISYALPGTPAIGPLMADALPISMQLGVAAILLLILTGLPLGVLAALTRNSPLDYLVVGATTVFSSIPQFVLPPVLVWLLVLQLGVLPGVGFGWHGIFAIETLLPALILAAAPLLSVVRYTRMSIIDTLAEDYVRTARAKGLRPQRILLWHIVRNALTPVVTQLGLATGALLAGSIFVETFFGIRGFGNITVTAFRSGDVRTAAATTFVSAVMIVFVNLGVDLLYSVLDPRVRYSQR